MEKGRLDWKFLTVLGVSALALGFSIGSFFKEPIPGPQGEKGDTGPIGISGENGVSITSVELLSSIENVDTYIIRFSNGTSSSFSITNGVDGKSIQGEPGVDGISVTSTSINNNGDLIISFSNGESVNAGHIKDTNKYTVNFYIDDALVFFQTVDSGSKVVPPEYEEFFVKHWYIDKEFENEWFCYGFTVTENLNLYGKYEPLLEEISFNEQSHFASITSDCFDIDSTINVSNGSYGNGYIASLNNRGIAFNKIEIGSIYKISVYINDNDFTSAKLYFGNYALSFDNSIDLHNGINEIHLDNNKYFTIQNEGSSALEISKISLSYSNNSNRNNFVDIPSISINTENNEQINSRNSYVDCKVSTSGSDTNFDDLQAKVKLRGNSTSNQEKKPYRIKLDKKNGLFGLKKSKNFALLADYFDGSKMHNFSALTFSKMINDDSFTVTPIHVNLFINDEYKGLYLICEHIDEKDEHLNISQDNVWEKSFDEINFYIERDLSTSQDNTEVENETYIRIPVTNYDNVTEFTFALKYPEKGDFEEELENGSTIFHQSEFESYVSNMKEYIKNVVNLFGLYRNDNSYFNEVCDLVDVESLAKYGVVDQLFRELDHGLKSFKMYKKAGEKLMFGPNWDYDLCVLGLPIGTTYVDKPFESGLQVFNSTYISESWSKALFLDNQNGFPLYKDIFNKIDDKFIQDYLYSLKNEQAKTSVSLLRECEMWMCSKYYSLFDNLSYNYKFLETQINYLKNTVYSTYL